MTLTVLARDATTGEMGIAVFSGYLAVGRSVPWVRPGIGVVASQGLGEPRHGEHILELLSSGIGPSDALAQTLENDPSEQVAR